MVANRPAVLINCTACTVGGGVQVAVGFVKYIASAPNITFRPVFALSSEVDRECGAELRHSFPVIVAEGRPGAIFSGLRTRRALSRFATGCSAKAVFTVFGPSYVDFDQPEITGFADGFAFAEDRACHIRHPWWSRLLSPFLRAVKLRFLSRSVAFWVETESARQSLSRVLGVPLSSVTVIPNALNLAILREAKGVPPVSPPRFLLLAAGYWHKNHEIAAPMARALSDLLPGTDFRIDVTLPPKSPIWAKLQAQAELLGVADKIHNFGPLSLADCARAIEESLVVLHPSLLETFSATYLEAMGLGRPLLVSDRPFAREICGDAAVYFDPLDPDDAARKAAELIRDAALRQRLVSLGTTRLTAFPGPEQKNQSLVELITCFLKNHA